MNKSILFLMSFISVCGMQPGMLYSYDSETFGAYVPYLKMACVGLASAAAGAWATHYVLSGKIVGYQKVLAKKDSDLGAKDAGIRKLNNDLADSIARENVLKRQLEDCTMQKDLLQKASDKELERASSAQRQHQRDSNEDFVMCEMLENGFTHFLRVFFRAGDAHFKDFIDQDIKKTFHNKMRTIAAGKNPARRFELAGDLMATVGFYCLLKNALGKASHGTHVSDVLGSLENSGFVICPADDADQSKCPVIQNNVYRQCIKILKGENITLASARNTLSARFDQMMREEIK